MNKTPPRDPITALLEFSVDYEQTPVEAEQELRGADVVMASCETDAIADATRRWGFKFTKATSESPFK